MSLPQDEVNRLKQTKTIGIIGLGDMGLLYAKRFSEAGWKVVGCDREEIYEDIKLKYFNEKFEILKNGHFVSRISDYIIYSVEAENIDKIVSIYAPSTKFGAIVGGQTSCKAPEIAAFEKYLPSDNEIISIHSLHGPKVNTTGQPLVLIKHRASEESFKFVESIVSCLNSKQVNLTAKEHDRITADTQAVTHAAFLSMGVAWKSVNQYPWETPRWIGGIENAKINISLRIFSNKWHVYAGLAITNPSAHDQVLQYSKSTTELFTLMIQGKKQELTDRLLKAKEFVFENIKNHHDLLLDDNILQKFSLSKTPPEGKQPNSHLSLLAIVDSWHKLGIIPYDHIICSTPLFRIFLGVTEYVFCTPGYLEESIEVAINDSTFRQDDLNFTIAAQSWSKIISFGNFDLYKQEFEDTQNFFQPMFQEANAIGNEMIKTILERVKERESS
ncbi:prephenate dehydrogenase [Candida tropicalis MYA-3404]|uniref:Prephenate dehydrogenase [NADP(+)] n=1 Tax=Candida tropicalis (strain ATCC MYA-3404 / T1) TaxID=294747 RepID=C5M2D9_CANTT|nr:prephenate dehydrogenase [Candida tropicalis MYA-3404]EER35489.1 prephenate dehydrogenase [Candida tropicalis MYA-3404]KAG4409595.1 hypothetical protein JTP64_000233 [Candida tropicalis]MCP8717357.1 prephenate dehydrogenase [Asgard group archaeon]